jgi:hypothetical protein
VDLPCHRQRYDWGVSEQPFYKPNRTPPPPRTAKPGEFLWELRREPVTWSGELRFHGESYGWEAQILRDGELAIGQRFLLRDQAVAWAEKQRQHLLGSLTPGTP